MTKKKIYVVVKGGKPGIYQTWSGEGGAAEQVHGFPGAVYRGFVRPGDALAWLKSLDAEGISPELRATLVASLRGAASGEGESLPDSGGDERSIVIYTDGGAIGNPGPGGYGAVLRFGEHQREISGGYRMTTNNRMELMACIAALEALKKPRPGQPSNPVVIYSDSRYVVDGIKQGWAETWRRHGWQRANGETAENVDLWSRLLALCDEYDVTFRWVKGHAGRPGNERADRLASEAAQREDLPADPAFEAGETQTITPRLL
jgi:ribonuclease HI